MADKIYEGARAEPFFEGKKIKVRGYEFAVPALSFGNHDDLIEEIEYVQSSPLKVVDAKKRGTSEWTEELESDYQDALKANRHEQRKVMKAVYKIGLAALNQNYPELTEEHAKRLFSVAQMGEVFRIAIGAEAPSDDAPARPTSGQTSQS